MASQGHTLRIDAFSSITRILDAARRVFATGDGAGTLDRIAREAGVGIATLYRHFPNRQTLARAVYERIFTEEIQPILAQISDGDAPRPVLLDVAERLSDIAQRERGLVSSIGNLTEATTELLQRSTEAITPIVQRAQQAGTIRPDIDADDIPHLLAMVAAALGVLDADRTTRRRYLSLLLDALNPAQATPLPTRQPRRPAKRGPTRT
ncbi:helix-turn-helix domain-containing protein [Phytohabitans sp. ZYX-F-186]|uniref:Helix-turn-helix domain-containing protein n=1 Tax=Phytohabitans maris TaxID=3071409 RepID=A0ABU0ZCL8_9ACTN|nr:helix-turn-helix domain-containing protein [Phytohabitans sp. ZYX-F-186]MDQ7904801.1 helix-turn-helix domain-containing protein [Phytohabitans sp. ZYX-F-186]